MVELACRADDAMRRWLRTEVGKKYLRWTRKKRRRKRTKPKRTRDPRANSGFGTGLGPAPDAALRGTGHRMVTE